MVLHIYNHLTIEDIQERFTKCFPGLKLEFYKTPHDSRKKIITPDFIKPEEKIGSLIGLHEQGNLELKSWHTVGFVEKAFRNRFGIYAQVFRLEKGAWIQTTGTETLTLMNQMDLSVKTSRRMIPPYKETLEEYGYL